MLKRYLFFILFFPILFSCSKDKLQTRPSIKIKNVSSSEVFPGQDLRITLEYDDKEGDLGNGIVTYIRDRLNIRPIPDAASNDKVDTIRNTIPDFPKSSTGEMEIKIAGGLLDEDPNDNDTMIFKIFVQDIAGNVSDTLSTGTIVERKN
jgi:hypothetical protein